MKGELLKGQPLENVCGAREAYPEFMDEYSDDRSGNNQCGNHIAQAVPAHKTGINKRETLASKKQRSAARNNIKKAAGAAKRKQTLKKLPKKTRRALGKQAAKARQSRR